MDLRLPIGIENFKELRENSFYYVDKTTFIKELLDNWGKVNVITRPQRFGKTVMLSMLKSFFEIGCDKSLFQGLKILQDEEVCTQHMGKYPVIYLSFRNVDGFDFDMALDSLWSIVSEEINRFRFILEGDKLSNTDKHNYTSLIHCSRIREDNYGTLIDSLRTLTDLLYKYYGRKVILLVDSYDAPFSRETSYKKELIFLVQAMFKRVLKDNEALHFAVLVDCLYNKNGVLFELSNLNVSTVVDPRYCDSFGFTEDEVSAMLEYYGLSQHKETICDWYGGYQFGEWLLCCPLDVVTHCNNLLQNGDVKPISYWGDEVLQFFHCIDLNDKFLLDSLLNSIPVSKECSISGDNCYDIDDFDRLYSMGYLTGSRTGGKFSIRIPNKGIHKLLVSAAFSWYRGIIQLDDVMASQFCRALFDGNLSMVYSMFTEYLADAICIWGAPCHKSAFYRALLYEILSFYGECTVRFKNDNFYACEDGHTCIVRIDYTDEDLHWASAQALREAKEDSDGRLWYGIAVCEKECAVSMEQKKGITLAGYLGRK